MAVPVIEQDGESHEANVTSLDGTGMVMGPVPQCAAALRMVMAVPMVTE